MKRSKISPDQEFWVASALQVIAIALALYLTILGAFHLLQWRNNPAPAVYKYAEFASTHPAADWVRLTDCRVNYAEAVGIRRAASDPMDIYVPVRELHAEHSAVQVVLKTPPGATHDLVEAFLTSHREAQRQFAAEHQPQLVREGPVTGLRLRPFLGSDPPDLSQAQWTLANDAVILMEGAAPSPRTGWIQLGIAGALFIYVAFLQRSKRRLRKRSHEPELSLP